MTDDREFYAATVQEAVDKAADELGLSSGEVPFRVLDEGNAGFLGIGARDARILVETEADLSADAGSSSLSEIYRDSSEDEQVEAPEDLLDEVRELVSSILEAMGFESRVEVY